MLEILLLVFLCKSLGKMLRAKGRNPLGLQILLVVMWIGGELVGGVAAAVLQVGANNQAAPELNATVYLFAILGAVAGAGLTFLVAFALPPTIDPQRPDFAEGSAFRQAPADVSQFDAIEPHNPYRSPFAPTSQAQRVDLGQPTTSGFGIASVVLGVIGWLLEVGLVITAGTMVASGNDPDEATQVAVGLGMLVGLGLTALGAVFAIVGFLQKNRGRVFPILGLLINGALLAVVGGLLAIGLAAG